MAFWLAAGALLCVLSGGALVWLQRTPGVEAERGRVDAEPRQQDVLRERQGERDCERCPAMLRVSPGFFVMGSPETEHGRRDSEGPQQRMTIVRTFWLGKYEVTRGEFAAFVVYSRQEQRAVVRSGMQVTKSYLAQKIARSVRIYRTIGGYYDVEIGWRIERKEGGDPSVRSGPTTVSTAP
jgi:formylglycine-generating enzyme required for sulfatase activity